MAFSKEKAHERAEKFAAKGQHDRAAREYQTIVEADPKDIRAWLMLADCLVRCGDRAGAVDRYLQVAGYYAAQKQSQKALAVYRQVVNLDPRRIDVHQKIAQLNLELGRVQDAVAIYEQLGHAQLQAGNTADALVTFELIANAEPTAVSKRLRVAELYSRERQPEKAVEHFRIAGDQLLANGRRSDFVRVAERLIYHKPDDTPTIRGLARAYLELKDPRRALMKLNALLHADPHDREGLELLAETFLALEKPDKATSVAIELVRQLQAIGDAGSVDAGRIARRALAWDPHNAELLSAARSAPTEVPPRSPTMPPEPAAGAAAARAPVDRRPAQAQPQVQAAQARTAPPPSRVRTQPQQQLDEAFDDEVAEPMGAEPEDDVEEADDVLELDDADVMSDSSQIRIAEPAPATARYGHQELRAAGAAQSMTNRVLSEVETSAATVDSVDFDKILFEARVYIKYRLFEHAIEHIGELLAAQPEHVGALALRARALGELGRGNEAAETHIRVARLVADRDPKLAREHVTAAIDCDPSNMVAQALRADLDGTPVHGTALEDGLADHGDSGTFDVVGDDVSGPVSTPSGDDHEFEIEVSEQQEEVVHTRPIAVENRFGLSDARPLPGPDEGSHEHAHTEDLAPDIQGALLQHDERTEHADKTPLFGYRARPPGQDDAPTESLGQPDGTTGRFAPTREAGAPEPVHGARPGRLRVEPASEVEPSTLPQVPLDAAAIAVQLEDEESLPPPEPPKPAVAKTMKPMPTAPATPMPATGSWPDLGDELAEVRFFLDQGLEDDARASLAELDRRHKGHPEVAALLRELDRETAQPQQHSGATPLVDLSAEDEEEDAYLSAIFGGEPAQKKKDKSVEIRATTTGVDPGDPSTAYDLGMAYREMGLVDDALAQFEQAARDPGWEARALVMSGTLRVHRGETDRALADLRRAIESATNEDELYEAKYELAVIYETLGNTDGAIEELYGVPAGYRERDEKLAALES
ncbi:MAG TPA: tetratricopeptide repeat protein [Nannocystaceae bacterium]|nr:tetratricopeptide repeat protein [Nannocystaceae bacterium]